MHQTEPDGRAVLPADPQPASNKADRPSRGKVSFATSGYCLAPDSEVTNLYLEGRFRESTSLPGDFVLAFHDPEGDVLISSALAVQNYFCTVVDGRLQHGSCVSDVMHSASLRWEWDYEAVAYQFELTHLVNDLSLHRSVRRMPPRSVVLAHGGRAHVESFPAFEWLHPEGWKTSLNEAVDALVESTRRIAESDGVIALSGGLDSRLMLAAYLALGK